jgi:hypothetical protein
MLGLGYPGGPVVDKRAQSGNPYAFAFPRPLCDKPGCDFSFSGIKTAARTFLDRTDAPYDEKYINVIEHCEHTYRMSLFGFYTPFYSFADIANSRDFIEDTGIQTSIQHDIAYTNNMKKAYMHFLKTYGKKLIDVKIPTQEEIFYFLKNKIII